MEKKFISEYLPKMQSIQLKVLKKIKENQSIDVEMHLGDSAARVDITFYESCPSNVIRRFCVYSFYEKYRNDLELQNAINFAKEFVK